jgi:hypothetical protein
MYVSYKKQPKPMALVAPLPLPVKKKPLKLKMREENKKKQAALEKSVGTFDMDDWTGRELSEKEKEDKEFRNKIYNVKRDNYLKYIKKP